MFYILKRLILLYQFFCSLFFGNADFDSFDFQICLCCVKTFLFSGTSTPSPNLVQNPFFVVAMTCAYSCAPRIGMRLSNVCMIFFFVDFALLFHQHPCVHFFSSRCFHIFNVFFYSVVLFDIRILYNFYTTCFIVDWGGFHQYIH